jgi:hypothetical protein
VPTIEELDNEIRNLKAKVGRLLDDERLGEAISGPLPISDTRAQYRYHSSGVLYYPGGMLSDTPSPSTNGAIGSNKIWAIPFLPATNRKMFDLLSVNVTTLASAANARLGIYEDGVGDSSGFPGRLVADVGTVSVSTTGVKTVGARRVLSRSLKWLCVVSDGNPQMTLVPTVGAWAILGRTGFTTYAVGWRSDFTYSALPGSFPTTNATRMQAPPLILIRAVL